MRGKFAVGELWHGDKRVLGEWVEATGASVFDFNLFYRLQGMCNQKGAFDMRELAREGYFRVNPFKAVTFVENHDTARKEPVVLDKLLGYAFVLTMEGRPCVYYEDYAVHGLKPGIDALIAARRELAGGSSTVLHADEDLLIVQRNGHEDRPGLILVLNDGQAPRQAWVTSKWREVTLEDRVGGQPPRRAHADGRVELGAPARGYAVYAPPAPANGGANGINGSLGQ
jgi:alpha-amylase